MVGNSLPALFSETSPQLRFLLGRDVYRLDMLEANLKHMA
jgi:hypothetical protein